MRRNRGATRQRGDGTKGSRKACVPASPRTFVPLILVVLLTLTDSAHAETIKFNIDCEVGWQGCYRPGAWTPVDIGMTSSAKQPFEGMLELSGSRESMAAMTVAHRFVLTPDVPLWVPLVMRLASGGSECRLSITDANGRDVWAKDYSLWDPGSGRQALIPVAPAEGLIGVGGRTAFGLRQLPQAAHTLRIVGRPAAGAAGADRASKDDVPGKLYVKDRPERRLPWDWTGYDGLDALILYDPEWTAMAPQQSRAVVDWVTRGGRLLIVLGGHPLSAKHPVAGLLPAAPGEARQVTLAAEAMRRWGGEKAAAPAAVTAWTLDRPAAWGWSAEEYGTGQPLYAHGPAGFGRVGVLAFDPAALERQPGGNLGRFAFWIEHLAPLLDVRTVVAGPFDDKDERAGHWVRDESSGAPLAIMNYLVDIPQMRPLSIWVIIVLLFSLAAVIGPVDYFILKRRDRLPLTWMTFTIYIAVFSVAAYYGVKALRHGQAQIRTLTVIDAVEGRPEAWATSHAGIFAPESDAYALAGLERGQWWEPFSGATDYYGYNYGYNSTAMRDVLCFQEDGANLPAPIPISIWSMQCLAAESAVRPAPLAARVERHGRRASVRLTNLTDRAITGGVVRFKDNEALLLERVAPRETKVVEGEVSPAVAWSVPSEEGRYGRSPALPADTLERGGVFFAGGSLVRTRAMQAAMERGAAVVSVEFEQPAACGLADRPHETHHRQWVRLLVVPGKEGSHDKD